MLLPYLQDVRVPIDDKMFSLLDQPIIAFSVAAAGRCRPARSFCPY